MQEIDPNQSDTEIATSLGRELTRLQNLQELRAQGVEIAVSTAARIAKIIETDDKAQLRDLNRSLEIVTKTSVMADDELRKSQRAEVEATAPQRDIVLIILESTIPDIRKRMMFEALALEMGDEGGQIVYDALVKESSEDRAREILELEA